MRANGKWIKKGEMFLHIAMILAMLFAGESLKAQDLEETLEQLPQDPAKEFVRPLTDAFGANLNTGWLSNAAKASVSGLDFKIGLVFMGAFIDKDKDVFIVLDQFFPLTESQATAVAQSTGAPPQDIPAIVAQLTDPSGIRLKSTTSGPNIFGSEDENVTVELDEQTIQVGGTSYLIPRQVLQVTEVQGILQDPGIFPTVAPQLSIGTLYGTQATLRYLPNTRYVDEIGKISYFAWGIQHNPLVWFKNPLPLDFSLAFFHQNLKIEDLADTRSTAFGVNVSKTFGGFVGSITPYGGFMIEKTEMDINYQYTPIPGGPPIVFDFTIEGANENRFILGLGLNVIGLNILADYNFSEVNTLNLSVLYGF